MNMEITEKAKYRFLSKVELVPSGCAEWNGAKIRGYGYFTMNQAGFRVITTHRLAYMLYTGEIPVGLYIDHMCRNKSCVNPNHLRAVSPRTNAIENNTGPAALNNAKTTCINGHDFTKENTRYVRAGRHCIQCARRLNREWRARQKLKYIV